jgi:hypothetical protein
MKFWIFATDDWPTVVDEHFEVTGCEYNRFIEIAGLDDLLRLCRVADEKLIVGVDEDLGPYIEIYNGYRE